jgi:NAD(P)H-flavin reductase
MNKIIQTTGVITNVTNLSPTAREYTITPTEPMPFIAGGFVNIFVEDQGETVRRAFSMSSSDTNTQQFTLTIRLSPGGRLTPLLWEEDFLGREVKLMGPLGLNTADNMHHSNVYLFGFGVGAGVVKSLAEHMVHRTDVQTLTIVTGNRSPEEILHKDFFDTLAAQHDNLRVQYVVSDKNQTTYPVGYIQDHLGAYNFDHSDVYVCGQRVACDALVQKVTVTAPKDCSFFIEDFH